MSMSCFKSVTYHVQHRVQSVFDRGIELLMVKWQTIL